MKLSDEQLKKDKERFISILAEACEARQIQGDHWQALIDKLENSNWFTSPASTRYHASYEGGLVRHSLNVYDNLMDLVRMKGLEESIRPDSIAIVALLHDFSKMNLYEPGVRNVKKYYPEGSKFDAMGHFDWVAEPTFNMVEDSKRFIYGNHEETSEFMIRQYIPLSYIESCAIINHHGGMGFDSVQGKSPMDAMTRYPLVALLHMADMLACTIDESEV